MSFVIRLQADRDAFVALSIEISGLVCTMTLVAISVLFSLFCHVAALPPPMPQPLITIGLQSILGPLEQWGPTLNAYLTNNTPYTFNVIPYSNDSLMVADAKAQNLQLTLAGPVQYLCLALAGSTSDGVAEVVSASRMNGAPVERLAGAIVTTASSKLASLQDLRGKTVLTGPIASLASFAAQWSVLLANGIDLFRDFKAVYLQANTTQILPDLLAGVGDVAFVGGGFIERFYPNSTLFQVLNPLPVDDAYPYKHSTPLYPNVVMSALDTIPYTVRKTIAEALFSISPDSHVAEAGLYYEFTPLGAYTQIRTLMAQLGLLNNMTQCRTIADLADLVVCPSGYVKDINYQSGCAAEGVACPDGYQCICSPCNRVIRHSELLGLRPQAFIGVMVVVGLILLLAMFIMLRLCSLWTRPDPYNDLALESAEIIGQSSTGPVFGTTWKGQPVAVKRLFPRFRGPHSVFDGDPRDGCAGQWKGLAEGFLMSVMECFCITTTNSANIAHIKQRMHVHSANILPILGYSRGRYRSEAIAIMPRVMTGTIGDLMAGQTYSNDIGNVLSIAGDVANAISFFHSTSAPVVGKSLKPHHLFVDESFRTLLGISFRPPNPQSVWAPPECVKGLSPWTKEADIYAFSMLLYTLVQGQFPFEGRRSADLLSAVKVADEDTVLDARPPLATDSPFNALIQQCWAQDPQERPTIADVKGTLAGIGACRPSRPSVSLSKREQGQTTSSGLLQGMFPDHVRKLLEQGLPVPTEQFACVTIFFSDIKGFTEIASVLKPAAVKSLLDALYTFMDTCAEDFQVHKMETIGDGFVAVTNVMKNQPDHAPRMAAFALAALAGASKIPVNPDLPSGPKIQLRIGLHSGPVCAGVVGKKNLRYCLFGNNMNIASRMESCGEPGRIQLSRAAASLIAKDPELVRFVKPRAGFVDVKGQGQMSTCWLTCGGMQPRRSDDDRMPRSRRDSFLQSLSEGARQSLDERPPRLNE